MDIAGATGAQSLFLGRKRRGRGFETALQPDTEVESSSVFFAEVALGELYRSMAAARPRKSV